MAAVSNCSPLRYFIAIGRADLLFAVLGRIAVPSAVFRELTDPPAPEPVRSWMKNRPEWLTVDSAAVSDSAITIRLDETLDPGES